MAKWLREELYILFHEESPPLSWRGIWQRARCYLWIFAIWCLGTSALLATDAILYRPSIGDFNIAWRELIAVWLLFELGAWLLKLLIRRVGVFSNHSR